MTSTQNDTPRFATREDRQRAIGAWHREWSAKWAHTVIPDPAYAHDGPSQYDEGMIDVSCSVEANDDYWAGIDRILGPRPGT